MEDLQIDVQRIGGIWHGTIKGYPDVDERGLTEEVATRKVKEVVDRIRRERQPPMTSPT